MDLKYKILMVSVALNVIWISTLVIDFDVQSWIPKAIFPSTKNAKINNTTIGLLTTESSSLQTSSSSAYHVTTLAVLFTSSNTYPTSHHSTPGITTVTKPITSLRGSTSSSKVLQSSSVSASSHPATTIPPSSPPSSPTSSSFTPTHSIITSSSTLPSNVHLTSLPKPAKPEPKKDNFTYILNLPGCKMKYYDPFDAQVKPYYEKNTDLHCGKSYVFANGTELKIDKAAMSKAFKCKESNISCSVYEIIRKGEGKSDRQYDVKLVQELTAQTYNATQEFVEIRCLKNNTVVYDDFFAFIHPKEKAEQRCENITKALQGKDKRKEKFNFVAIGLDSVSHRNFLRHFPKTYNELKSNFDVLEYNGYTKIGLNTFPCLLPMLTGKSEEELNLGKGPYDNINFIWKNFTNLGYRTLFGEDWPQIAIFHYLKQGFYYPPTDYYLRPFYLAVQSSQMRSLGKGKCFNSRRELTIPLQWCRDFLTVFPDKPLFSFSFMSHLTHDYLNDAGYGDDPLFDFVSWYRNSSARNNSFLLLYSDHGIRWGSFRSTDMGAQEDSLPFFYLLAPPWFQAKYPVFYKNLQLNQNKLTTMFDVHEMLKDILNFTGDPKAVKPTFRQRGISLFDEIPEERTCDDAGIGPEYCVCHLRKHIDVNSSYAILAAKTLVDAINHETNPERKKCEILSLRNITSARLHAVNKRNNKTELKNLDSFKLTVYTVPGEGLFEGVVLCEHASQSACTVSGAIDRINKYGNQSICINSSLMKNYCYCSDQSQNSTKAKS